MYKIVEDRFQKLYKQYAVNSEEVDEYSSYLTSVAEDGTNLFDVPQQFQTNELVLLALETENNPVHLSTRRAIEKSISMERLELSKLFRKYAEPITEEERESYLTDLTSIINLKYGRYFSENRLFNEKCLYTFIDFFRAVTKFYSGMDTICYLYLYRGFPIPIRIKKNGRRQNFKLSYDAEQKMLSLIKVTAGEYKSSREALSSKLETYYGSSSYLDEYCWEEAPTNETVIPILQDGVYYETFKTIEENGILYDYTHTCILSVPKNLVEFCIPEGVSSIPNNCFMGQSTLRKVIFPSSLGYIPKAAFLDCGSLEEVDLSAIEVNDFSKIIVGSAAFCNCKSLKHIDMSKLKLEGGAELCFAYCLGIESIAKLEMPGLNRSQMNFLHCESLKELVNDPYVDYGEFELAYCLKLNSISFHGHTIPAGLLCGCEGLEHVEFVEDNKMRKEFGNYCFAGCKSIKVIDTLIGGAQIGNYSFADCDNLERVVIRKKDEWYSEIPPTAFKGSPNVIIEWSDDSYYPKQETISDYWKRKGIETDLQNEQEKDSGLKAKDVYLNVYEEIKVADNDKKCNAIGKLFRNQGRYIGLEVLYILKHNVCTWEEYLKLGRLFYECIPFSNMNDSGIIRTAIVSWAKSCSIQAYLQAPIHHKFEAIQQVYSIIKISHSYFEDGVVVYGEKSQQYASFDVLNTYFDYQVIEEKATDEQKEFIGKFCSLSDIRMSYLMEHYLLKHLIKYNTILGKNDWSFEYANKEIEKISKHANKFCPVAPAFLNELGRHTWQQFIKDDIEKNYEELGDDELCLERNEADYISFDESSGKICRYTERISDSSPRGANLMIPDEYVQHDYDYDDNGSGYGRYAGTYVQDEMGWSDEDIDTVLDGDPDAYWTID